MTCNYDGLFGRKCQICGKVMTPITEFLVVTGCPFPKALYHRVCYEGEK